MFDISLPFLSFQPQSVAWEFWNAFATQVLFTFNNYVNQFMIYIHTRFIVRSSIIKESVTHESTKSLEVQGKTLYRYCYLHPLLLAPAQCPVKICIVIIDQESKSRSVNLSFWFFTSISSSITASASTLPESSFLLLASCKYKQSTL